MRYQDFLRQRYCTILGYTGLISLVISLTLLAPLVALFAYPEEEEPSLGVLGYSGDMRLSGAPALASTPP